MRTAKTSPRRLAVLALCACAAALMLFPAPAARAASTGQILKLLNAERAANGIPAGVVENPVWSVACQLHNAYEHRYNELSHSETEGKPGFSSAGNLIAQTSVLAQGIYWGPPTGTANPYDNAPFHLFDLLNPRISSTGAVGLRRLRLRRDRARHAAARAAAVTAYSYPATTAAACRSPSARKRCRNRPPRRSASARRRPGRAVRVLRRPVDERLARPADRDRDPAFLTRLGRPALDRQLELEPASVHGRDPRPGRAAAALHHIPRVGDRRRLPGSCRGRTSNRRSLDMSGGSGRRRRLRAAPSTACFADFATQLAVCGLSRTWDVAENFSFKTAGHARKKH